MTIDPLDTVATDAPDAEQRGGSSSLLGTSRRDRRTRQRQPPPRTIAAAREHSPVDQTDTYEQLRTDVLAAIQQRGATTDTEPVRTLIRRRVDDYQASARSGLGGTPLADPDDMVRRLSRAILEYGPLTRFITGDEQYEEVMAHGTDVSYIDTDGRLAALEEPITEPELRSIVDRLLATAGASVDESRPIVQAQVLGGRARLGVVIPPIADSIDVTLRRYVMRRESLEEFIRWDSLTPAAASLLAATSLTPTGLVITGQPGAGKTSLANAVLRAAPPALRVVCCEDTPELQVDNLNASRWRTRPAGPDGSGEVTLRDLVKMALGMRPDLIVVGEVRGAEAYELTRAGNAGCGMITTLHANSARQGLQALISTAIMAGANVPADQVRVVFTSIVDLVVHLDREPLQLKRPGQGPIRRQVMEIAAIPPLQGSEADFTIEPIFQRKEFGAPLRWTGAPLPEELRERLDRALRPQGMTTLDLLDSRKSLL